MVFSWSRTREFIGNVFRPLWTSAECRQHKANDVFRRWAPLLSDLSLPIQERMEAFRISVGSSVLWLVSCWTFTKTQTSKLGQLSARQLCRMVSGRRRPYELSVEHWTGSPAALLPATTSFCWSPCAVRIGIFGPQNAHDPRLGVVENVSFRTRRTERQTEKASRSTLQCLAVGNTSGDILRPCASETARSTKYVTVYFHGFSVIVAFSICPASVYAQGVCKLPSAQSRVVVAQECRVCAAILASVSCMVWTFERSADEDRHTAVLGGKEVRGSTAMAQVCATSPLHSAHSSLPSLHRRPGRCVNTRLQCVAQPPSWAVCQHAAPECSEEEPPAKGVSKPPGFG